MINIGQAKSMRLLVILEAKIDIANGGYVAPTRQLPLESIIDCV